MIEPDKSLKKKDQIKFYEEMAKRLAEELEAELEEEEERVTIQREEEANLISWDNTQALIEADYELAQRLQVEEQGELTIEERAKLFIQTYRWKEHKFKNQMLFDKEMKRVDSFVPMDSEVVEGSGKKTKSSRKETVSKKRAVEELDEESVKRQKLEDDAEKAEVQLCLEIVPRDDEAINVESLSTKYPIFDWKIHILTEDKIQDVLDLYRLIKERFETTSLKGYDRLLWGDLITLLEPSEEDEIWKA
ncbi:hypothetical protein Tco_0223102 [Tanacetum coccineum]